MLSRRDIRSCTDIVKLYLLSTKYINNWDLVDTSASYILGAYLFEFKQTRNILYTLARSPHLWRKRIAIIASGYFITKHQFADTIKIARLLLNDIHDLIHKAVGWVLREVGKRDKAVLVAFLGTHASHMPRTMLRYAIEKFSWRERQKYLDMV